MRRLLSIIVALVATLALTGTAIAGTTVWYTGQGFEFDGTTWELEEERCGLAGENAADDGGTGQFANWNGPGQPYETGQGYLLWVLTANGATSAKLTLPSGTVDMIQVGGTFKYASQYWSRDDLVGVAKAVYKGKVRGAVQLVVSHGCRPFIGGDGAWCSPGYWRNASDASWALIKVEKTALFGATVEIDPNYVPSATQPSNVELYTILLFPQTYAGPDIGSFYGWNANAFNLTGAWLTDQLEDYHFDPNLVGRDDACPIDHHGREK